MSLVTISLPVELLGLLVIAAEDSLRVVDGREPYGLSDMEVAQLRPLLSSLLDVLVEELPLT